MNGMEDQSRAEFAYSRLREGIRTSEFLPGQRLREADLALMLNISRTPVREAMKRLIAEGLIEFVPGRGMAITQLNRQQVRELYMLRKVLEGAAAGFAAVNATDDEIDYMADVLKRDGIHPSDHAKLAHQNRLFHNAIHDASQNRYLQQALSQMRDYLGLLPGTTFSVPGRADEAHEEHLQILNAIKAKDSKRAEDCARHHIEGAGQARIALMFTAQTLV